MNLPRYFFLLIAWTAVTLSIAHAGPKKKGKTEEASTKTLISPDKRWRVEARSEPERTGEDGSHDYAKVTLTVAQEGNWNREKAPARKFVCSGTLKDLKWSPDSEFLVSIFEFERDNEKFGRFQAVAFRVADGSFRDLSGYFPDGYVAKPGIGFEGKNSVVLLIDLYQSFDGTHPGISMHIPLTEEWQKLLPMDRREEDWSGDFQEKESPDYQLQAVVRRTFTDELPWNTDADSFKLFIRTNEAYEVRASFDCPGARILDRMEWSPDSRFLVMTTESSGGHSPMNENTYVYCKDDDSLRRLSNYGPHSFVTKDGISFVWQNTVLLGVFDHIEDDAVQEQERYYTAAIPLEREIKKMPQVAMKDGHGVSNSPPNNSISGLVTLASPDGKWFAAARPIPDERVAWKAGVYRYCLVIAGMKDQQPTDIAFQFDRTPGQVTQMIWSPDSHYLSMTLRQRKEKGDDEWKVAVYCVEDGSLRDASATMSRGTVDGRWIGYDGGDTLLFYMNGAENGEGNYKAEIPLDEKAMKLPKIEISGQGK